MEGCQIFSDDWDMPARTTSVCGCGFPAREHPRRPAQPAEDGAVSLLETIKEMREIRNDFYSLVLRQSMNEKWPKITEVVITQSEFTNGDSFLDLMEIFHGFDRADVATKIEDFASTHPPKSTELDFTFCWEGQQL
mmetsp:Transcript_17962/g.24633  ORF Transcript_17962/g.24633 Transcript_17962/m.24633 type:complete len:136 (+) Transcript_17962:77-484(+)